MAIIKQIFAWLGLVLGAVGIVLCLAVIIGTWWINTPMTEGLLRVFPPIEDALAFGSEVSTDLNEFVVNVQTQLEETPEEEDVAEAIQDQTQEANTYVNVAIGALNAVEQVAQALAEGGANPTSRISTAANRILETLDALDRTFEQLQSIAEQIEGGREERIAALNEQLDALQVNLTEIDTAISQTETNVADVKSSLPRWIDIGAIVVTLIFVWFGAAQFFLMQNSWQFIRSR